MMVAALVSASRLSIGEIRNVSLPPSLPRTRAAVRVGHYP